MAEIPILTCSASDYAASVGKKLSEYELVEIKIETINYDELENCIEQEAMEKKCEVVTDRIPIQIILPEIEKREQFATYIINATGLRQKPANLKELIKKQFSKEAVIANFG